MDLDSTIEKLASDVLDKAAKGKKLDREELLILAVYELWRLEREIREEVDKVERGMEKMYQLTDVVKALRELCGYVYDVAQKKGEPGKA
ncbi:MAG: hypothetical protein TU35_001080 [Thermoproteus sp. AZ2]|jgi:propanediol dehydratase small subunit|uniref:Uncharacterized protein n=1 Tax=Thermoproteus sp. AZ2 TaxID=1609232 RepID=A0ACC6UYG0_9CREN|nr:MAG: hypothetical protein TU35_08755 [Thermoproteus sp. AZ2]